MMLVGHAAADVADAEPREDSDDGDADRHDDCDVERRARRFQPFCEVADESDDIVRDRGDRKPLDRFLQAQL